MQINHHSTVTGIRLQGGFKSFSLAMPLILFIFYFFFFAFHGLKKVTYLFSRNNRDADLFKVPDLEGETASFRVSVGELQSACTICCLHHAGSIHGLLRRLYWTLIWVNLNAPRKASLGWSPYLEIKLKPNALGLLIRAAYQLAVGVFFFVDFFFFFFFTSTWELRTSFRCFYLISFALKSR